MLKKIILSLVDKIPFELVNLIPINFPLIPYYHVISDDELPHICNLYNYKNIKQFISDIDFIASNYKPISLLELIDCVKKGSEIKKKSFLLTFDDGYKEMYDIVAPILYKKGVPSVFFLSTDFIDNRDLCYQNKASLIIDVLKKNHSQLKRLTEHKAWFFRMNQDEIIKNILTVDYKKRHFLDKLANYLGIDFTEFIKTYQPYLSRQQIKSMIEDGFYFGAHSKDHPKYCEISMNEQIIQTLESLKFMRQEFSLPYSIFAFPYGTRVDSIEFLLKIRSHVDLTFCTSDFRRDIVPWNLQRINFERSLLPAEKILARYKVKSLIYRIC